MIVSVLQDLGYSMEDVKMCLMEGHLILQLKDGTFFETTTNETVRLNRDEQAQLDPIGDLDDYLSLLLSNQGTAMGLEAQGRFQMGVGDPDKLNHAIETLREALTLNPHNMNAKMNLMFLLKHGGERQTTIQERASLNQSMLADLVYNYYGISPEAESFPKMQEREKKPPPKPALRELSVNAMRESEYIREKFEKYAEFCYYYADNYQEAVNVYRALLESAQGDGSRSIDAQYYKIYIAQGLFRSHDLENYLNEADATIQDAEKGSQAYYLEDNIAILRTQKLVAEIVLGKKTFSRENVSAFLTQYAGDPIVAWLRSGRVPSNIQYQDAIEILTNWEGYPKLKQIIQGVKE